MKRGFLYGLATFLILGALYLVAFKLLPYVIQEHDFLFSLPDTRLAAAITIVMSVTLGGLGYLLIRVARRAPGHRTWWHAVVGWVIGFFIIDALIFAIAIMSEFVHPR